MSNDPVQVRARIKKAIERKHGPITPGILRQVAAKARIAETTLSRLLRYEGVKATKSPRPSTISAIAFALDVSSNFLETGVKSVQKEIPFDLQARYAEPPSDDPVDSLMNVVSGIRDLPKETKTRACRDAVDAILAAVAQAGVMMPAAAYLSMMHLDAMQRREPTKARAL
ncbi:MAG TPA: helix-turn-helix transcriptional regulator [Longimicrobium sp.]